MKKNLLSVIILALLIVNIVLSSIMMYSFTSTNKKTAELVANISTVLNLQLTTPGQDTVVEEAVPMSELAIWNLDGSMTIPLRSLDGKNHSIMFNISFTMNTKAKGRICFACLCRESLVSLCSRLHIFE